VRHTPTHMAVVRPHTSTNAYSSPTGVFFVFLVDLPPTHYSLIPFFPSHLQHLLHHCTSTTAQAPPRPSSLAISEFTLGLPLQTSTSATMSRRADDRHLQPASEILRRPTNNGGEGRPSPRRPR
jgi:hypothetical protein